MSSIQFDPSVTTNATGLFVSQTNGYMQGVAINQPANDLNLDSGPINATSTQILFGGQPIKLAFPSGGLMIKTGPVIDGITAQTDIISGVAVFNKSAALISSSSQDVPVASGGGFINFYGKGSSAIVPMAVDPALVAALAGSDFGNQPALYWDVTNNRITATAGTNTPFPFKIIDLSPGNNNTIAKVGGNWTWSLTAGTPLALVQII